MKRVKKQIGLPGFSETEQRKLMDTKVLVIGSGGLGCPVILYLAAAGIGTIGVVDGDKIEETNLNRQVLYSESDIGQLKAVVTKKYLENKYSDLQVNAYPVQLDVQNAFEIIKGYDIVLDCTDNFSARYMISDACALMKKPLVFGAIFQHEGQMMVFDPSHQTPLHYRHVYPRPPLPDEVPDCNIAGVLGVLPGLIGICMATEVIKIASRFGISLVNKMMVFNIMDNSRFEIDITPNKEADALLPKDEIEFLSRDYSVNCNLSETISWEKAIQRLGSTNPSILLMDIREAGEAPELDDHKHVRFPFSDIIKEEDLNLDAGVVLVFCQSGLRSVKAVKYLHKMFPGKEFYSIDGGIADPMSPVNFNYYEKA